MAAGTITPQQQAQMQAAAQKQAQAQAATEIAGQVGPLQGQVAQLTKQGQQQVGSLTNEFQNNLIPAAQHEAQQTAAFNQNAQGAEAGIFQQATSQMNTLAQNQAQQAQQIAQQTGGPVSTGMFTSGLQPYQTAEVQSGAVSQLTGLNLGTIGTNEAQMFAGQVLPAMESLQKSTARANIASQIADLKKQITTIQGTKSKLVDAKLPALLAAKQGFALNVAQLAQKRIAANRAWTATKRGLDQRDRTLSLTEQNQAFNKWLAKQELGQKGRVITDQEKNQLFNEWLAKGKLGISQQQVDAYSQHLTATEKLDAERLGITKQELAARILQYSASNKIAEQRLGIQAQSNARAIIDAALGGTGSNRPTTVTVKKWLNSGDPSKNIPADPLVTAALNAGGLFSKGKPPSNVYYDTNRRQWYTYVKNTMTPQQFATQYNPGGTPMSDPNALLAVLKQGVPGRSESFYVNLIRLRLGIPDWKPGQPAAYTPQSLGALDINKLTDIAMSRGFQPSPVKTGKQALIDFILHHGGKG